MAVAFSEQEKEKIREALLCAARESLKQYGIRKTTVDDLARRAGISKGAFYLFYESKEHLFFDVINEFQVSISKRMIKSVSPDNPMRAQSFAQTLLDLLREVQESFLLGMLERNEFEYLIRKLPQELMEEHQKLDDLLTEQLLNGISAHSAHNSAVVSAAFRGVFLLLLHKKEIGEEQFDEAIALTITALSNEVFREE